MLTLSTTTPPRPPSRPAGCQWVLPVLLALAVLALPGGAHARKTGANSKAVTARGTFVKTLDRAPGAASSWQLAQDRFGRFAMGLPPEWTQQPAENHGENYNLVAGDSVPRDGFSANVMVTQEVPPAGLRIKADMVPEYATLVSKQLASYKYVLKDQAFTRLDGIPCIVVGGTMEIKGRTLRSLQLRLVHRKVMYLVTFTSLEKYYPQYEAVFARIVRTMLFEREGVPLQSPIPVPETSPTPSPSPALPSPSPSPQVLPASPSPAPSPSPSPSSER